MNTPVLNLIKRAAAMVLFVPALALAAGTGLHLDRVQVSKDPASLQRGAKLFVNYCLSCHSASFMRYNQLENIGLTETMIRDNLMFTTDRIGDLMKVSMRPADAKVWFGTAVPDLTLIARQRASEDGSGADWIYTYLRQFYRDESRPTGWNNVVFESVGMPHVLWELQGDQVATVVEDGHGGKSIELSLAKPGKLSPADYDQAITDLVSFLVWMGDPVAEKRQTIGLFVLVFLVGLFVLSYALKKNYWKDIH